MTRPRRILVLTRHTPLPWEDGAGAYLFGLLRFLHTQGFEIHVAWLAPHDHLRWQGSWALPPDFARVVSLHTPGAWRIGRRQVYPAVYWLPFKARVLHATKRLLGGAGLRVGKKPQNPYLRAEPTPAQPSACGLPASDFSLPPAALSSPSTGWMAAPSAAEHAYTARLGARLRPDVLIVNYAWLTPLFAAVSTTPPAHRACLHPDVAWKRAALQAALDGRAPEITRAAEAGLLARAQTIVGISEADALELRAMAPSSAVVVAPKSVAPQPQPESGDTGRLLFVGSGNSFNAAGLSWFLTGVWPLVRAAEPTAEFDVCGNIASAVRARPAGVHFHGMVGDLAPFYRAATVVVVPLLHATGLNIKLVDAAAQARAVVTTSATLEGAPFLADAVARADTPAAFAGAVLGLLREPAERQRLAGLALGAVATALNPAACFGPLAAHLRQPATPSQIQFPVTLGPQPAAGQLATRPPAGAGVSHP